MEGRIPSWHGGPSPAWGRSQPGVGVPAQNEGPSPAFGGGSQCSMEVLCSLAGAVPSWWRDSHLGRVGFPIQHGGHSPTWGILAWGGDPIPVHGSQPGMRLTAHCGRSHPLVGVPVWRSYPNVGVPAQHGESQCGVLILEVGCPIPVWSQQVRGVSGLTWGSQCNVTPGVFQ